MSNINVDTLLSINCVTVNRENLFSGSLDQCKAPVVIKNVIIVLHFISRLSMIVQVNVVLNRTVVVDSD